MLWYFLFCPCYSLIICQRFIMTNSLFTASKILFLINLPKSSTSAFCLYSIQMGNSNNITIEHSTKQGYFISYLFWDLKGQNRYPDQPSDYEGMTSTILSFLPVQQVPWVNRHFLLPAQIYQLVFLQVQIPVRNPPSAQSIISDQIKLNQKVLEGIIPFKNRTGIQGLLVQKED